MLLAFFGMMALTQSCSNQETVKEELPIIADLKQAIDECSKFKHSDRTIGGNLKQFKKWGKLVFEASSEKDKEANTLARQLSTLLKQTQNDCMPILRLEFVKDIHGTLGKYGIDVSVEGERNETFILKSEIFEDKISQEKIQEMIDIQVIRLRFKNIKYTLPDNSETASKEYDPAQDSERILL